MEIDTDTKETTEMITTLPTYNEIMDSPRVTSATKGRVNRALGLNGMAPLPQADQDAAKAQAALEMGWTPAPTQAELDAYQARMERRYSVQ